MVTFLVLAEFFFSWTHFAHTTLKKKLFTRKISCRIRSKKLNPPLFEGSPLFLIPPFYIGNFLSLPPNGHFSDFPSPPLIRKGGGVELCTFFCLLKFELMPSIISSAGYVPKCPILGLFCTPFLTCPLHVMPSCLFLAKFSQRTGSATV